MVIITTRSNFPDHVFVQVAENAKAAMIPNLSLMTISLFLLPELPSWRKSEDARIRATVLDYILVFMAEKTLVSIMDTRSNLPEVAENAQLTSDLSIASRGIGHQGGPNSELVFV